MDGSAEAALDHDAFAKHLALPRGRATRELHALLAGAAETTEFTARVRWLERLARWLGRGALPGTSKEEAAREPPRNARLRLLVRALDTVPSLRLTTAELVAGVLRESSGFYLLSRLGLPGDRSFLAETMDRFSRRFLPSARDERDLAMVLEKLFGKRKDAAWVDGLDPELTAQLCAALDTGTTWKPLASATADAALLLATRISALGLSDDIRVRSPRVPLRESPLFRLPRATDALLALLERDAGAAPPAEIERAFHQVTQLLAECELTVHGVTANLEQFGVSVDVVYRLEVISKNMDRLQLLLEQLLPRAPAEHARCSTRLLSRLIADRVRDKSTLDLARTNLHLLARKIIERAGHTGEHYITASRGEYFKMLASAAGGGVLTVGTIMLKYIGGKLALAPAAEGLFAAMNYAGSFLLMQALGFTLATKQPSMTAAALAATLRERSSGGGAELDGLVAMIARITRSQLAAAIGNVGLVIPAAFAVDMLLKARGESFLNADKAHHVIESLDLLHSGTVFYAALTGVLLWTSSIAAGWIENWAVYRRIPEAIAQHRIGRLIGKRIPRWFSGVFTRNISGIGGNTALGLLLGMTPVLGKFFGLPLDVRHITLSTGSLTFAISALGHEAFEHRAIYAIAGIGVIGLLNFGVSFILALLVALRAREVDRAAQIRLVRAVLARLITHPREFLLPP
jgi:site-specific recombinase